MHSAYEKPVNAISDFLSIEQGKRKGEDINFCSSQ